jgi:hypothetical protein
MKLFKEKIFKTSSTLSAQPTMSHSSSQHQLGDTQSISEDSLASEHAHPVPVNKDSHEEKKHDHDSESHNPQTPSKFANFANQFKIDPKKTFNFPKLTPNK